MHMEVAAGTTGIEWDDMKTLWQFGHNNANNTIFKRFSL
jgi:hypothetical protein